MKNHPTADANCTDDKFNSEQPLVTADELLDRLWTPSARPSRAWLRAMTKRGVIPVVNLGRRVFFDPRSVRDALLEQAELDRRKRAATHGVYIRYERSARPKAGKI